MAPQATACADPLTMNISRKWNSWKKRFRIHLLKKSARFFPDSAFFLQGRMDIDHRSPWFDPGFNDATGGFLVKDDPVERKITDLEDHDNVRKDMFVLLCRSINERKVPGAIAELGVYRGRTARLLHHYFPDRPLHLFDTFQGFSKKDIDAERKTTGLNVDENHFADTNVEKVLSHINPLNDRVKVFPGYFPDSITRDIEGELYALVHLDADLYEPTLNGLKHFYDRLSKGGFVIVHDYNAWPGARKAVDEFCNSKGIFPIPMPDKSGSCLVLK